jgi:hypothetical protein
MNDYDQAKVQQLAELILKLTRVIADAFDKMPTEKLIENLSNLRTFLLELPASKSEEVFKHMESIRFEMVLVKILNDYIKENIVVLRETTWVFLILFSKEGNWFQRVKKSKILEIYENLLQVEDSEIIEHVA